MASNRIVLPDVKFTGQEDIREFLREFEIYVSLNEWTDDKAGKYLAVYLKEEAKAFYHQQEEPVRNSYKALSQALVERYEGGLALLKYKKEFNSRVRKDGEALHSYLSALRLSYTRAYTPPTVEPLSEEPSAEERKQYTEQQAALKFYNQRKGEDILCQFINGLNPDLREVLIRQDDLLTTPVETVVKRIDTLEKERGAINQVGAVKQSKLPEDIEGKIDQKVEEKIRKLLKPEDLPISAAFRRGGRRTAPKRGPKPTDLCRACNGHGHWARNCPTQAPLNGKEAGQRSRDQP